MKAVAEIEGGWPTWWYVCSECHVMIEKEVTPCPNCQAEVSWAGVLLKDSRKDLPGRRDRTGGMNCGEEEKNAERR